MTDVEHTPDALSPAGPGKKTRRLLFGGLVALGVIVVALVGAYSVFEIVDAPGKRNARWEKARSDMGELQKALTQHALEHQGRYPQTLAEVAPMFGGNLPRDPFTKAEFHYAPTAGGFVLTCLGNDGKPGGNGRPDADIVFTPEGESR